MKTKLTIRLPEDLRRRAEARAAEEGTTLLQVLRERLEEFAAGWDAIEEADDVRAIDEIEARIAWGEERLRDWAEVDAEIGVLLDQAHYHYLYRLTPSERGGFPCTGVTQIASY